MAAWSGAHQCAGTLAPQADLCRSAPGTCHAQRIGRWASRRWLGVRIAKRWHSGPDPESMISQVRVPIYLLHGTRDRLFGVNHSERLSRAAGGPSFLDVVGDMAHGISEVCATRV